MALLLLLPHCCCYTAAAAAAAALQLDVHWSSAFIKAVLDFPIKLQDLESVDPDLYHKKVVYLRDSLYATRDGMDLADLDLTFVDDSNEEEYLHSG